MKRRWIPPLVLLVLLVGVGGAVWWWQQPRTAEQSFERALKNQARLEEKIGLEKRTSSPDQAAMEAYERDIRGAWEEVERLWPGTAEAEEASFRLLERELASTAEPADRIALIEEFLEGHPEHGERKNLLWRKAEILRDGIEDPLAAVAAFGEIEREFPEDPIAPRAALAAARIYESIHEAPAAAKAYKELAEAYPSSPEAAQAQLRRASLLEDKLDRKREAAEVYEEIVEVSGGSSPTGRMAARQRRKILGELKQDEQEEYYKKTYRVRERNPLLITKEELNSPAMKRIREQGFDLEHYDIRLRLDPEASRLEAEVKIRGTLMHELDSPLLLQINPALELTDVRLAGSAELEYARRGPYLEIALPGPSSGARSSLELTVVYRGEVGSWFGDSLTTAGASLRTESKWYPQTHFGDTFTQSVTIDVPQGYRALAQGVEIEPSGGGVEPGWSRFVYVQERPSQFVTVAMGRYERLAFEGPGGLKMEVDLAPEHADEAEAFRRAMLESVRVFEEIYGPFPYKRLAVVEVPDFPGGYGAASLVLIGSVAFDQPGAPTKFLAHEIAHQWWGNLISIDLTEDSIPWLSEGFATYSDAVFTERTEGSQAFMNQILAMGNFYRENIVTFADRTIAETLWDSPMYRSLMYEKGALVLHSLRRELGDEPFFSLLSRFLEEHRFEIVHVGDFTEMASAIAGKPMDWFFEQQLHRSGYARPRIERAEARETAEGWALEIEIVQEEPAYRMTMDASIETSSGENLAVIELAGSSTLAKIDLDAADRPLRVRLDPERRHLIDIRDEVIEKAVQIVPSAIQAEAMPQAER